MVKPQADGLHVALHLAQLLQLRRGGQCLWKVQPMDGGGIKCTWKDLESEFSIELINLAKTVEMCRKTIIVFLHMSTVLAKFISSDLESQCLDHEVWRAHKILTNLDKFASNKLRSSEIRWFTKNHVIKYLDKVPKKHYSWEVNLGYI